MIQGSDGVGPAHCGCSIAANFVCGVDRYGYNVVAALPPPGSPKLAKAADWNVAHRARARARANRTRITTGNSSSLNGL